MPIKILFVGLLLSACLQAQQSGTPEGSVPPDQKAVIEANRKGARPRLVAKGKGLSPEERERARVFESAKPSVVYINASANFVLRDLATGDVYSIPAGTGTGFVWDDLGHVVTNYHVIKNDAFLDAENMENIAVSLADGKTYKARLIGRSLADDIAVLHVFAPLKDLKPLPLGSSREVVVGQSVLAIGNPFHLDHTLTSGIVSALGRVIVSSAQTPIKGVIQTDAAINPGNSGGPLLDMSGRLIGMNTAIPNVTGANVGIGFAIPADILNRVVPVLIAKGQIGRPSLGFSSLNPYGASRIFGIDKGVVVKAVEPGGPAARAGLRGFIDRGPDKVPILGDVIVGFQGKPLDSDVQLADQLELLPPETPLVFDVMREGKKLKITLRPWEEAPKEETPKSELTL